MSFREWLFNAVVGFVVDVAIATPRKLAEFSGRKITEVRVLPERGEEIISYQPFGHQSIMNDEVRAWCKEYIKGAWGAEWTGPVKVQREVTLWFARFDDALYFTMKWPQVRIVR